MNVLLELPVPGEEPDPVGFHRIHREVEVVWAPGQGARHLERGENLRIFIFLQFPSLRVHFQ